MLSSTEPSPGSPRYFVHRARGGWAIRDRLRGVDVASSHHRETADVLLAELRATLRSEPNKGDADGA